MASKVCHLLLAGALLALPYVSSNLVELHDASEAAAGSVLQDPAPSPTSFERSVVADSAVPRAGSDHDLPPPVASNPWSPWNVWRAPDGGTPIGRDATGMKLVGVQLPQDISRSHEAATHDVTRPRGNLVPDLRQMPSADAAQPYDPPVDTFNSDPTPEQESLLRLIDVESTIRKKRKSLKKKTTTPMPDYDYGTDEVTLSPEELKKFNEGFAPLSVPRENTAPTPKVSEESRGPSFLFAPVSSTTPPPQTTTRQELMTRTVDEIEDDHERRAGESTTIDVDGKGSHAGDDTSSVPRSNVITLLPRPLPQQDRMTPTTDGRHQLPVNLPYPQYPQYPPYPQYLQYPPYPYQYGPGIFIQPIPYVQPMAAMNPATHPPSLSVSIPQASWSPPSSWSAQLSQPVASQYADASAASIQSQVPAASLQFQGGGHSWPWPWPWPHQAPLLVSIQIFASPAVAPRNDSNTGH